MGRKQTGLSEKHWQALKLIEEGALNYKEIAKQIGWGEDYFFDLRSGNVERAGHAADLFAKEMQKIDAKNDSIARSLIKENIVTAQELLKRALADLKSKEVMSHEDKKLLGTLTNCLSKSIPNVSVDSLAYSYTKGLTPEELIHEFTRLKAIAESSFDRS